MLQYRNIKNVKQNDMQHDMILSWNLCSYFQKYALLGVISYPYYPISLSSYLQENVKLIHMG